MDDLLVTIVCRFAPLATRVDENADSVTIHFDKAVTDTATELLDVKGEHAEAKD